MYQVIVGNVGLVLATSSYMEALHEYRNYVEISKSGDGSAGQENVTMLRGGEIVKEFDFNDWLEEEMDRGLRRTYGF